MFRTASIHPGVYVLVAYSSVTLVESLADGSNVTSGGTQMTERAGVTAGGRIARLLLGRSSFSRVSDDVSVLAD